VAGIPWTIGCCSIRPATDKSITPWVRRVGRPLLHGGSERLEPDIGKPICPVLRGGGGGNVVSLLDAMRVTVMTQMAKGLLSPGETAGQIDIQDQLDRLKWSLWHGNVYKALRKIEYLEMDLEAMEESPEQRKLYKAVREFGGYIAANKPYIPNYGDRYRNGEPISTAMAESAVNQVISKRFVKKQQMKWTKRGAHLLLQVRTHVLNDELRDLFCQWYPGMQTREEPAQQAA
jgi:hypothetical protein